MRRVFCAPAVRQLATSATTVPPRVLQIPVIPATAQTVAPFGTLFQNFERERVRLQQWPKPDWRAVVDGLGGGETQGSFNLDWRQGAHFAHNTGVADGQYCFAWLTKQAALQASAHSARDQANTPLPTTSDQNTPQQVDTTNSPVYCFREINYHACGSQCFYSDDAAFYLLVAAIDKTPRFPDEVLPTDFTALIVPPGVGVNVNAFVWHAPPIATKQSIQMHTKQARVHSKVYYDPLEEHNTLLCVTPNL